MAKKSILILNGPGLADLSDFDSNDDGEITLARIEQACAVQCEKLGIKQEFRQTDSEHEMFRFIASESEDYDGLIINPVGCSHAASVNAELFQNAIMLIAHLEKPLIEVHISNIFLSDSGVTRPLSVPGGDLGFVSGLGVQSYLLAIKAIEKRIQRETV